MGSRLRQRTSNSACLVVPPFFGADSGTNVIKHGENVIGRTNGSLAQLAECLHFEFESTGRPRFSCDMW